VGVRVAPSALKHGVAFEDIVAAMTTQARKVIPDFDEPRAPGHLKPTLYIGLSRAGQLLEVLAAVTPPDDVFIFHAMLLRPEIAERARFYQGYPEHPNEEG
jgi:hypothetical protein